jgi:peptidoglycan/LPS O-acetylase OafA/YrhL
MGRVSAFDGLRGFAVLLVMSLHFIGFGQGWIGVEIFFVLSGYLITTILWNERDKPHFWKVFYLRRVTRILPAFAGLLCLAILLGTMQWRVLWPYLIFFGANIADVKHYDAMVATGFGVLWSLAVEEHFYFVWPAQIRAFSSRKLSLILVIVIILEPILRLTAMLKGADWKLTYYLTPFRLDGLAVGSLLAIGLADDRIRSIAVKIEPFALTGSILAIAILFPLFAGLGVGFFVNAFSYFLISFATASVLVHILSRPTGWVASSFSWKPIVFVGRISYGLYLYQVVVLIAVKRLSIRFGYTHGLRILAVAALLSVGLAWLSFYFYELPILEWGKKKVGFYREEFKVDFIPLSDSKRATGIEVVDTLPQNRQRPPSIQARTL